MALMMYSIAIFQGLLLVQVYLGPVFEEALPSVSANLSTILFALVNIIAGLIAACLLDYVGRRVRTLYFSFTICYILMCDLPAGGPLCGITITLTW